MTVRSLHSRIGYTFDLLAQTKRMFANPNLRFSYPATPSHGAWCLAIAFIGQANFNQQHPTIALTLNEVFTQAESIPHEWVKEAVGRAKQFGLTVYESVDFEESDFSSMCIFPSMCYRSSHNKLEAEFHHRALLQLQQLQKVILELHQLNKLTPASLTRKLKAIAPLTIFKMKKSRWVEESSNSVLLTAD